MMGLFIVSKLLLITLALQSTEEKWKIHATPEPDNSVRFGKFCLRISDDSHRTSSKSVTQQPTKSARPAKQTTQQPTTEPADQSTQQTTKPAYPSKLTEETSQPHTEELNDIIVRRIAPLNFHGGDVVRDVLDGCYCDKREKKHLNETSSFRTITTWFPSEICNSTEVIGELKDGSKVCMTGSSISDYFNAISGPQSEPANVASSYEEPLVTSPPPLDPTTELPMTTHPSVTESKQHDPTPQMTQTPQHTTHICESCNFKTNLDDIDLKAVQSINVTEQPFPCPVHIYVSLKDEDFCLDLDQLEFNTMLRRLEKEIPSAHEDNYDWMPENITSCHCQETEQKPPTETSPITSTRIWLPSETCNTTEFIEKVMDGREVCVTGHSILTYFKPERTVLPKPGPGPDFSMVAPVEEVDVIKHLFRPELEYIMAEPVKEVLSIAIEDRTSHGQSNIRDKVAFEPICPHCMHFHFHNIEPNDVRSVKMDVISLHCPIIIHVTLKNNENFCVDSSQPGFRTLLEKLKI